MPPVPRLAYFSPLPPQHTGVADYSAGLLPFLRQRVALSLFVEDPVVVPAELHEQYAVQTFDSYAGQRWQFDIPLYHLGNNRHHQAIYDLSLRYPGIVELHDYYLHPFLADRAARENNFGAYSRELAYALGKQGIHLGRQVQMGEVPRPDTAFPLNDRLLDLSLGIIVHNQAAAADILQKRPKIKIAAIPLFVKPQTAQSQREKLAWAEDAVIVGHYGYLTANRQFPLFLQTFARLRETMPQLHLLIVGEIVNQEVDVAGLMDEFSLGEVVHVTGYVPEKQSFMDWMATADFLVNLRHPTMGETSHSTLLAFSLARPVILFNHGWYAELPAEICYQIPVMDEEALFQAMAALATRPALRTQIGNQAQSYVVKNCDPEQIAGQYAGFINRVLLRPTPPATNYPG